MLLTASGQGVDKEVPLAICPDQRLRPADLLLRHWDGGRHLAIDLTIAHGWQAAAQSSSGAVTRERWRRFLCTKETEKNVHYDADCARESWSFAAMAFGTWGGMGPECAKLLHRIVKRAARWQEGPERASRQEECQHIIGMALLRHIWDILAGKTVL